MVARARACLGVRFRPGGRSRETGLDCVGLAAEAVRAAAPDGLAQRGTPKLNFDAVAGAARLARAGEPLAPGDLLLMQVAARQLHLAVWTGDGIVHADAGLRRVVERPGRPEWTVVAVYRLPDQALSVAEVGQAY